MDSIFHPQQVEPGIYGALLQKPVTSQTSHNAMATGDTATGNWLLTDFTAPEKAFHHSFLLPFDIPTVNNNDTSYSTL